LPDVNKIQLNNNLKVGAFKSNKIGKIHSCNTMESLKEIEQIIKKMSLIK
jgi:hypothetical protein